MTSKTTDNNEKNESRCNVNTAFNFGVGVVALIAAGVIAYVVIQYFR